MMSTTFAPRTIPAPAFHWPTRASLATASFLIVLFVIALLGPRLVTSNPETVSLSERLRAPIGLGGQWAHPFGTDQLGRDVLARVVAGARISLTVAIAATVVAGTVGTIIGLLGGYFGGLADRFAVWLGDVQMAVPFVVVAIGIGATLSPSAVNVVLILGATGWATYARVARLAAQPLRTAAFVDAARVAGATNRRIVFRHVLPVILPPLIAIASQQAGAMMLYEAALSYLGLGVPAGTITWGGMIADSRETSLTAWWATVVPGIAIVLVVIGFNATGAVISRRLVDGPKSSIRRQDQ